MLRNLFAGSIANLRSNVLTSYLQQHAIQPQKLAGMLAIFIVPISALGWWCYSVVLSVGAMAPLQSASGSTSDVTVSESSITSDTSVNPADVTSSSSAVRSSDSADVDVNNSSSQTTVEINGQSVPVAQEGTTHKVIQHDNGQTTVDVSIDSDTSGRTTSRSSTNINLRSSSSSDVDIRSKEIR
jgi:hypothetical protein